MTRLLSPKEVAERLGISYATVLDHIHAGHLPKRNLAVGCGKPRYRISEQDIEDFVNGRTEDRKPQQRRKRRPRKPKKDYFAGKI